MTLTLILAVVLSGCSGGGNGDDTPTIYIGMPYQGGKIAYILQPGDPGYVSGDTHGLIAATADQSDGIVWNDNENFGYEWYNDIGGLSGLLGTGQENTTKIVTAVGDYGRDYAAKLCDDYINPDTGTGVYSDWFLPSKDELHKLYLNKTAIGEFADGMYWSSTEDGTSFADYQNFSDGTQSSDFKNSTFRVRAVRYF